MRRMEGVLCSFIISFTIEIMFLISLFGYGEKSILISHIFEEDDLNYVILWIITIITFAVFYYCYILLYGTEKNHELINLLCVVSQLCSILLFQWDTYRKRLFTLLCFYIYLSLHFYYLYNNSYILASCITLFLIIGCLLPINVAYWVGFLFHLLNPNLTLKKVEATKQISVAREKRKV